MTVPIRTVASDRDRATDRLPDGEPAPGPADGDTVLVAVPRDVEALRGTDPARAHRWRPAVRDALGSLLDQGATVQGFDRTGWYVLSRTRGEQL